MNTPFEQEVETFLVNKKIDFIDNTRSFRLTDFVLKEYYKRKENFYLEVKEKEKQYNTDNWSLIAPADEQFAFILDELSARKILVRSPFSGIMIRMNRAQRYYWFSILDPFLMPKMRVNRKISKKKTLLKGKWILDVRSGRECGSISELFICVKEYLAQLEELYFTKLDCHGKFRGETIPTQGETRTPAYWKEDISTARKQ